MPCGSRNFTPTPATRVHENHEPPRLTSASPHAHLSVQPPIINPLFSSLPMQSSPLRSSVIGSYPFPSWLEFASQHLEAFGRSDVSEIQDDAVIAAIHDQVGAGLDVITDGEQTRLDFNLSFYGYIEGIELEAASPRKFGPPAHDQRGKHPITGELRAPRGLGVVDEFKRLQRLAPAGGPTLKASVPGPYTLSGRLVPNRQYADRFAVTEALLPIIRKELEDLVAAGCEEVSVDEPSMSC